MLGEISENGQLPHGKLSNFMYIDGHFKVTLNLKRTLDEINFAHYYYTQTLDLKLSFIKSKRHSSHYSDE